MKIYYCPECGEELLEDATYWDDETGKQYCGEHDVPVEFVREVNDEK